MKDFDELIRESLLDSPKPNKELEQIMIREYEKKTTKQKKSRSSKWIAALVIPTALIMAGVGAYAASENGFFRDKTNPFGAVTGSTYENATNEISIRAEYAEDAVNVTFDFLQPTIFPYREIETVRLYGTDIKLTGSSGVIESKEWDTGAVAITENQATLTLPTGTLPAGSYQLSVQTVIGEKKADPPLEINGSWNMSFTVG